MVGEHRILRGKVYSIGRAAGAIGAAGVQALQGQDAHAQQPTAATQVLGAASAATPDFAQITAAHGPAVVNITVTGTRKASAALPPGMDEEALEFFRRFGGPGMDGPQREQPLVERIARVLDGAAHSSNATPTGRIKPLNAPANNENEIMAHPTLSMRGTFTPCRSGSWPRMAMSAVSDSCVRGSSPATSSHTPSHETIRKAMPTASETGSAPRVMPPMASTLRCSEWIFERTACQPASPMRLAPNGSSAVTRQSM